MLLCVLEGLVLCFILLLVCVINIQNGPVGGVHYYEKPVIDRVVELGLITREEIAKNRNISGLVLLSGMLILAPFMAFGINGASGFKEGFIQLTVMYMISGLFDSVFIDWYWVGHTRAWIIPGTEDLMPYIGRDSWIKKIIGTVVLYPALAALIALIFSLF